MERRNDFLLRYAFFAAGLYLLAAGIVLILRSGLGTTPISSLTYVLSLNLPLSLGACTFLINLVMIACQFRFIRPYRTRRLVIEILLQIPFSFLFGLFIDLNMHFTAALRPANYASAFGILAAGCLIQATGVVLEVKPQVAMMSAEGFVSYAARRYGREFGALKVLFDVTLVALAAVTSWLFTGRIEGIREGTLIAACCTGGIVSFLARRVLTRNHFERMLHPLRRSLQPSKKPGE